MNDEVKCSVNIVQSKQIKLLVVVLREVHVVHEHLPHLVDGNGGIDRTLQSQLTHQIWKGTQVDRVRVAEQDGIYAVQVSAERIVL